MRGAVGECVHSFFAVGGGFHPGALVGEHDMGQVSFGVPGCGDKGCAIPAVIAVDVILINDFFIVFPYVFSL